MLKHTVYLGVAICLMSASASAFSGISAKFDGQYKGVAEVVPTSAASCAPMALDKVNIKAGHLSSGTAGMNVAGFITEEGYIDASMKPADGNKAKMDGRHTGSEISAGAIDSSSGCAWIVKLYKAD